MILFGASASPYVRKVLVFAAEKGIALERGMDAGGPPDPAFLEASPFRKIPAFRDGDFKLADSTAIVAYLEKLEPEPALIPAEAKAHARAIWFEEYADTILGSAVVPIFFNRLVAPMLGRPADLAAADRAEAEALPPALDYLEGVVPASGFLVEDRLTLADIAVCSFFCNLGHLGLGQNAATHPKTTAYVQSILARPSFAAIIEAENAMFGRAA